MPKSNRSGQAAILRTTQLDEVMAAGRISEVLSLKWGNLYDDFLVIPKCITKKKVRTREIPLSPQLKHELAVWKTTWPEVYKRTPDASDYLFPTGGDISKTLLRRAADRLLRAACEKLGYNGVSTHSFRRSALTAASDAGIPVRHIMELSGHSSLSVLQTYLSCSQEQKHAVALAFG